MRSAIGVRVGWLVAAYVVASVLVYAMRDAYLELVLPAIGYVVDALLPRGFERAALAVAEVQGQQLIVLDAAVSAPVDLPHMRVPEGEIVNASTLSSYALQHVALVIAVLVAWPASTVGARAVMLVAAPAAIAVATLLDIPFVLAGLVHQLLIDARAASEPSAGLALYYEFIHRGGRIGLSIAVAVAAALLCSGRRAPPPPDPSRRLE